MKTRNHEFTLNSSDRKNMSLALWAVSKRWLGIILLWGIGLLALHLSDNLQAAPGDKKWTYATGGAIINTCPAIGPDGTVYVGCSAPTLLAVTGATGKLKWEFNSGDGVRFASPTLGSDGTLYVGTLNGRVQNS